MHKSNALDEEVRLCETIILHHKAILVFPVEIKASYETAALLFQLLATLLCNSPEVQFDLWWWGEGMVGARQEVFTWEKGQLPEGSLQRPAGIDFGQQRVGVCTTTVPCPQRPRVRPEVMPGTPAVASAMPQTLLQMQTITGMPVKSIITYIHYNLQHSVSCTVATASGEICSRRNWRSTRGQIPVQCEFVPAVQRRQQELASSTDGLLSGCLAATLSALAGAHTQRLQPQPVHECSCETKVVPCKMPRGHPRQQEVTQPTEKRLAKPLPESTPSCTSGGGTNLLARGIGSLQGIVLYRRGGLKLARHALPEQDLVSCVVPVRL